MERWWYSDNKNNGKDKVPKFKRSPIKKCEVIKNWKFTVLTNFELHKFERIALTGSVDELGDWDPDRAVLLSEDNSGE